MRLIAFDFAVSIPGTVQIYCEVKNFVNDSTISYIMSEAGPSQQPPPVMEAGQGKKRKRTGKEREERKQAAILAVSDSTHDF